MVYSITFPRPKKQKLKLVFLHSKYLCARKIKFSYFNICKQSVFKIIYCVRILLFCEKINCNLTSKKKEVK